MIKKFLNVISYIKNIRVLHYIKVIKKRSKGKENDFNYKI